MPNTKTSLLASTLLTAALCAPAAHAQTAGHPASTGHAPAAPATTHATTGHATSTATTGHTSATATTGHASSTPSTAHGTTGHAAPATGAGRRPALYHGTFQVTSSTTVTITAPLAQTETRETHETVQVSPGNESDLVFDVNSDTGDHCVLNANRNPDGSVRFLPGQPCQVTDNVRGVTLQLSLTDGTGTVRGDTLALRIRWSVSGSAFFMRIVGTGVQASNGRRVAATAGHTL